MTYQIVNINNKRIAKNTLMLYIRMLITMAVSLFTVRILLEALGVVDYGIYNVVGGLITFMSFLTATMSSATQRYLSFSLGKKDKKAFEQLFSMNILIYLLLAAIVVILAETVGLWFLNNYLVVPENRLSAANYVYQLSLLTFVIYLLTIPYHSAILAEEKMNVYAYVSILDACLKLTLVYLVVVIDYDKLIFYGFLLTLQTILITSIYIFYCNRKIEGCKFVFFWEKKMFKQILSYTSWTLFGTLSGTLNNEGLSLLLNMFFGPVMNAAKGISDRVSSAITSFISNFYSAVKPQIVKSYASGDYSYMKILAFQSSKFSFYLMLILSLPLILETKYVLTLWLVDVEESMIIFTKLVLIYSLINVFEFPLTQLVHATGIVRKYQMFVGIFTLFTLPVAYILFKLGYPAYFAFIALIIIYILAYIPRLIIVRNQLNISIYEYITQVIAKTMVVSLVSVVLPLVIVFNMEAGFKRMVITTLVSLLSVLIATYIFGINKNERLIALTFLKNKVSTFRNKNE
jgi:O-antigen/teichoic acid export membrane protein